LFVIPFTLNGIMSFGVSRGRFGYVLVVGPWARFKSGIKKL
jgi:hypothetical protein